MRKTTFTFNSRGRSRDKQSSKLQFSLLTVLFLLLMGLSSGLYAQCSLTCQDNVQISLDENGIDTITVEDVIQNASSGCTGLFVIAYDQNNQPIPGNVVDCSYDGVTIDVGLYDDTGNNCWSTATIEDKLAPVITCVNDTITCGEAINLPIPTLEDNCSAPEDITVTELQNRFVDLDCDPSFTGFIVRTLRAEDGNGNVTPDSLICNDTLFIERIDFDEVVFPANQNDRDDTDPEADPSLLCDESNWTDSNGNGIPEPGEPGVNVPTLNGQPLLPGLLEECNADLNYEDEFATGSCKTKIFRTYTLREWYCGTLIDTSVLQMIEIIDESGPEVTAPNDITMTTNGFECETDVLIPEADIVDDCNAITRYEVSVPGFPQVTEDFPQDVIITLPAGTYTVTIRAYDACLNVGSSTLDVTIEDNTNPVAVCDQFTVASLTNNGTARVFASTFDDGSYDDCALDRVEVRRMGADCDGTPSQFGDFVEFCCADIGNNPIMVVFRVYDESGNTNDCMVEVEVQDKLPPTIECPPNLSVSCDLDFDITDLSMFGNVEVLNDLSDLNNPNLDPRDSILFDDTGDDISGERFYGLDGYVYDNCASSVRELDPVDNRDQCGVGNIIRTFQVLDGAGQVISTCFQTINVSNFTPFDEQINFPNDVTVTNLCSSDAITPQYLEDTFGEAFGFPQIIEDRCAQVGYSKNDMVFTVTNPNEESCFKIMRTWKVLDWCNPQREPMTDIQIIVVENTIDPEFTGVCTDTLLFSNDDDCASRFVTLTQSATDDCTPADELDYEYTITLFSDDSDPANIITGNTNNASGEYPIGTHMIRWTVEDRCGNTDVCEFEFTIDNRKAATPVVYNGLSADLMGIDSDQDGEFDDGGMLTLTPDYFNRGSFHSCGIDFTLSFSDDPNDTTIDFDCDDVGQVEVEIWTHSANGATSMVRTYILIQANDGQCGAGNTGPTYPVGGLVSGLTNDGIPTVSVSLQGSNAPSVTTDDNGAFSFASMPEGGNYEVVPELSGDILNGVTTWDLTLIQRHILGIDEINSPYKLIAADINKDEKITGKDLTELRRVILGLEDEFRNNKSWRFADRAYNFVSNDPLSEDFPESYDISNLSAPMSSVNFTGMKIGDLNNSVDLSEIAEGRTAGSIALSIDDASYEAGETVEVDVTSDMFRNAHTLQYTMTYSDGLTFAGVKAGKLDVTSENIGNVAQGVLTTSWNTVNAMNVNESDVLFTLVFYADAAGKLSNSIAVTSAITPALAYVNGEEQGVEVEFRNSGTATVEYALYQNVPNPVSNETVIGFNMAEQASASLTVYDMNGKVIKVVDGEFAQGYNEVKINSDELGASGVLYYRLEADNFSASKKMIVLK